LEPEGRRFWLPHPLYVAIPWIYLSIGTAALLGALYLPDWAWQLPYAGLFGIALVHAGLRIALMRRAARQRKSCGAIGELTG
jgi:hypothetical protein